MSGSASQFTGDIPGNYDTGLGPVIFEDYAADIARRASALRPARVLELAAGTGIVSRALRDALPRDTPLAVTDLNAAMLSVARTKFRDDENVSFAPADAMALNLPDGDFDLVVCQFGVMFFPDKQASFREVLRVLRPGGCYLFNVWGAIGDNPFARIAHEVSVKLFANDPPGFYRVPFSYADNAVVTADLTASGFVQIARETIVLQKSVRDFGAFARGLVFGNPLINEIIARKRATPDEVAREIERRLRAAFGPEPALMPLRASVFGARRG